jgi:hypothetical protein
VDLGVDPGTDTIVEVVEEPVEEPVDEPVDEPEPCEYPVGPYGFDRVGDIAGPATWPACIKAAGETYPSALANLADFQCDPEVQSIGVFFATQS